MIPRFDETRSDVIGNAGDDGDPIAAEVLFATLYGELHRMARREVRRRGEFVTLGATTLLHEAYLGLSGRRGPVFPDRARFLAYAARTMRGLIIDHVRRRHSQKRGGLLQFTSLDTAVEDTRLDEQALQDLGCALDDLAAMDPVLAQVVDLKFFCGFSFAEIGAMHSVSERTVQRQWERARVFLHRAVRTPASPPLTAAQVA
jgi:RNA polymerase sigma factor (TIGR02999 family)